MRKRTRCIWFLLLLGLGLLAYVAAFGESLTFPVRPSEYQVLGAREGWCDDLQQVRFTVFYWGLAGDERWRELYQTPFAHPGDRGPLRAISTYEPGEDGKLLDLWVDLPSGIKVFHGKEEVRTAGFQLPCDVIYAWTGRT